MPQNIKIYKFLFKAQINLFDLKANISSPLVVSWKRSNQTALSQSVEMLAGKAQINQLLSLPVNMYFDQAMQSFQEKKSVFSFTMKTPKGDKQAGLVHVNLAAQLNDKIQKLQKLFPLQKCPVKNSQVAMSITCECLGQNNNDNHSQNSFMLQASPSALSLQSHYTQQKKGKIKQMAKSPSPNKQNLTPSTQTKQLSQEIQILKKQKLKLEEQLKTQKQLTKKLSSSNSQNSLINSLKEQLMKAKDIQRKLETEIDGYRQDNIHNQKELQQIRHKMDHIYNNLCKQFDIQQL